MMIYPPIAKLVEKTGSRYTLVLEAAKRARQLTEGSAPLVETATCKEVSVATKEIFENKLNVFPMAGVDLTNPVATDDSDEEIKED